MRLKQCLQCTIITNFLIGRSYFRVNPAFVTLRFDFKVTTADKPPYRTCDTGQPHRRRQDFTYETFTATLQTICSVSTMTK